MKLWQCSICKRVGLWGPTWATFSSFIIDDEFPSYRVVVCSKKCEQIADEKHKSGEIQLPKFRHNGPMSRMTKPQRGYDPQPDQCKLLEMWNLEHLKDQIQP